jgi:hypothetical protein
MFTGKLHNLSKSSTTALTSKGIPSVTSKESVSFILLLSLVLLI